MTVGDALTLGVELMTGLLAQDAPRQTGPDFGKASPIGLIVVILLLISVFLLVWSMNKHLRRLPKSFGDDGSDPQNSGSVEGSTRDPG